MMGVLPYSTNQFGGVNVNLLQNSHVSKNFMQQLSCSLDLWQDQGVKVVWLTLANSLARLLPEIYQAGFANHHCRNGFITLTKRLVDDALVPDFANHTIGVGGVVINHKEEVLTIREKGHVKKYPNNWKFPGGMLDQYEHIADGVMREVLEETAIETEFVSLLGFRHAHQGQFKTSNIYAVCRLLPTSHQITIQESEIADARWFPIDEYLADEKIGDYNKAILKSAIACPGLVSIQLPGYEKMAGDYEVFIQSGKPK